MRAPAKSCEDAAAKARRMGRRPCSSVRPPLLKVLQGLVQDPDVGDCGVLVKCLRPPPLHLVTQVSKPRSPLLHHDMRWHIGSDRSCGRQWQRR
eukprot:CAMPEP_0171194848 /NCGR_PEP_ID=MMETSP0790-20130122/21099_1 /TAXON_ID=2925 /ORGANISM="Alexandrium catenella, Strain OF101" /LENGTH=93 /DNA_ID=CAMNT_0011660055 /DNA_START=34 /DNA_END=311 /DNA_ORIENTATION=+